MQERKGSLGPSLARGGSLGLPEVVEVVVDGISCNDPMNDDDADVRDAMQTKVELVGAGLVL